MNRRTVESAEVTEAHANDSRKNIRLRKRGFLLSCRWRDRRLAVLPVVLAAGLSMTGCRPQVAEAPGQAGPPDVTVVAMNAERVVLTTELPGRTAAYRMAQIRPQVNGLILKRVFTEGTDVRAGDLLYQIDPAPYQAAYDQAKAAVSMAEAQLPALRAREERFKTLAANHAVGQQDYDDALAALRQLEGQLAVNKAALESARINLSYTPIKSPISGRIGRSGVTEGALVTAYQPVPLATVQQLDPIYVDVPQSTVELLRLKRELENGSLSHDGQNQAKVTILHDDGTPYPREGTLEFSDITVDPTTGSVILRIVVPNPEGVLLPGMFVRAKLKEGARDDAILVPQQCVNRTQKGDPYAWVVDNTGVAAMRMLALDRAIGDKWLVCSGLAVGDRVILEGIQRVRPGASVNVVPAEREERPEPSSTNAVRSTAS